MRTASRMRFTVENEDNAFSFFASIFFFSFYVFHFFPYLFFCGSFVLSISCTVRFLFVISLFFFSLVSSFRVDSSDFELVYDCYFLETHCH